MACAHACQTCAAFLARDTVGSAPAEPCHRLLIATVIMPLPAAFRVGLFFGQDFRKQSIDSSQSFAPPTPPPPQSPPPRTPHTPQSPASPLPPASQAAPEPPAARLVAGAALAPHGQVWVVNQLSQVHGAERQVFFDRGVKGLAVVRGACIGCVAVQPGCHLLPRGVGLAVCRGGPGLGQGPALGEAAEEWQRGTQPMLGLAGAVAQSVLLRGPAEPAGRKTGGLTGSKPGNMSTCDYRTGLRVG